MDKMKHIVLALMLDILAFTLILPLFPHLLEYYRSHNDPWYLWTVDLLRSTLSHVLQKSGSTVPTFSDSVLIGGLLGSLFSFLQFLASPFIGRMSDRYGRKTTLLISMIGNIISAALWVCSRQFWLFVLARVIGGISEGNVQLSIAMITDLSTPSNRSRNLAWVGIAFASGFTIGPALGAYFASIDLVPLLPKWMGVYSFSATAGLSLLLLTVETCYIILLVPETLSPTARSNSSLKGIRNQPRTLDQSSQASLLLLLHFAYLFLFSGVEFVLPFLAFDRFHVSKASLGVLLSTAGLISSLIQGGYVRRMAWRIGERAIVLQGLVAASVCCLAYAITGTDYDFANQSKLQTTKFPWSMWLAMLAFAFATATVVNGMTALYSLLVAPLTGENISAGESLGYFRSAGQLGRSLGPLVASAVYWRWGSLSAFLSGAGCLVALLALASAGLTKRRNSSSSPATKNRKIE